MMQQGGKRLAGTNNASPKVSIICVTLNAAGTLNNLLKSIELCKTDDTELVIIDGNSTDGTVDVIKGNDHLVDFWLSEPDDGIYEAMNKAINYAKGQWLIFIGADDVLMKGFAKMVAQLKAPGTIYYGDVIYYGRKFSKRYTDYYLTKLNICHQGIFYPKAVFNKYDYAVKYRVYADYDLNLKCWKDPDFKFVHRHHLIASFPKGGFSSYSRDVLFENDRDRLFKQNLKPVSYYRYLKRTKGVVIALKSLLSK